MSELPLYTALRKGEIATAYEILERDKEAAIGEYSILETLFPLALTTLAELYDKHGVTGTEKQYFDLARTMWYFMPEGEREIPDMLCTFLYAGCKFNQVEFVRWVLPIVSRHPGISFTSLIVDRMYEHNQLRHSAIFYVCKNGSIDLYDLLAEACGNISPLLFEMKVFERNLSSSLSIGHRPPQPSTDHHSGSNESSTSHVNDSSSSPGQSSARDSIAAKADDPDPPALYTSIAAGHIKFMRHVLKSLSSQHVKSILRALIVHGFIPLDDSANAQKMYSLCQELEMDIDTLLFTFAVGKSAATVALKGSSFAAVDGKHVRSRVDSSFSGYSNAISTTNASAASTVNEPVVSYYGIQLCMFLSEHCCDSWLIRSPPSRRYVDWLLNQFSPLVTHHVAKMKWTGLHGFVQATSTSSSMPPSSNVSLFERWTPFHSACAAGCTDIAQKLALRNQRFITYVVNRIVGEKQVVYPIQIAVEASYWTKHYDIVSWIANLLSHAQLDIQLFHPCKGLYNSKPEFVKTLCKATQLSLRAMKQGGSSSNHVAAAVHSANSTSMQSPTRSRKSSVATSATADSDAMPVPSALSTEALQLEHKLGSIDLSVPLRDHRRVSGGAESDIADGSVIFDDEDMKSTMFRLDAINMTSSASINGLEAEAEPRERPGNLIFEESMPMFAASPKPTAVSSTWSTFLLSSVAYRHCDALNSISFQGTFGRFPSWIRRFDDVNLPEGMMEAYVSQLVALEDIPPLEISVEKTFSSALCLPTRKFRHSLLRFLGDSKADRPSIVVSPLETFTYLAFEACDEALVGLGKLADPTSFVFSLMTTVASLHAAGRVHGSVSPGVLFMKNGELKVADATLCPFLFRYLARSKNVDLCRFVASSYYDKFRPWLSPSNCAVLEEVASGKKALSEETVIELFSEENDRYSLAMTCKSLFAGNEGEKSLQAAVEKVRTGEATIGEALRGG
jgi:ankyrin repeat protein